jgi:hypothetical protein
MNKAILIREKLGDVVEINLDIAPHKNEIFKILEGRQTFIGQWPDIDVVIMKPEDGKVKNEAPDEEEEEDDVPDEEGQMDIEPDEEEVVEEEEYFSEPDA